MTPCHHLEVAPEPRLFITGPASGVDLILQASANNRTWERSATDRGKSARAQRRINPTRSALPSQGPYDEVKQPCGCNRPAIHSPRSFKSILTDL